MTAITTPTAPTAARTSSFAAAEIRRNALNDVGVQVADANAQTSTGLKGGGYASEATAEKTRLILDKVQIKLQGEASKDKASLITGRINLSVGAVQNIQSIRDDFHQLVTNAQNGITGDENFADRCRNFLGQLQIILNKKDFDGQSLFGGAATDRNPVNLDDALVPGSHETPTAAYDQYFKGDDALHSSTVHGEPVSYGFSAMDPGVRDLIFWLKSGTQVVPNGDPNSDSGQRLTLMQDGLHDVTKQLGQIKTNLGTQLGNVQRIEKDVDAEMSYTETTLHELIDADMLAQLIRHHEELLHQQMLMTLQTRETTAMTEMMRSI